MLQQTRIAAVLGYYARFLKQFPSLRALAAAPQAEVLRLWSGLGYYQRARNLHRAARDIVARHGGKFPRDVQLARALPGIGSYTLAAIFSIAFDEPLAVLDGNVARVLARLGALHGPLRQPRMWRNLQNQAQLLLDARAPGDWNQALMELGETICTPRSPRCDVCPVARWCRARALGVTGEIPTPRIKPAGVRVSLAAAVLRDPRGYTLLLRNPGRHDHVLFSRLRQFPAVEIHSDGAAELRRYLRDHLRLRVKSLRPLSALRHGVTFRNVRLLPFIVDVPRLPRRRDTQIVPLTSVARMAISSATRKIALAALDAAPQLS